MLNFRKLKQDFASGILREGKDLFEKNRVLAARLLHLDAKTMQIGGKILGQYDNTYETQIEIDRIDCEAVDSDCDCPYTHDCQHLAALLFYLEENLDKILVTYSKENELEGVGFNREQKREMLEKLKEAEKKVVAQEEEQYQKQVLQEYVNASEILSSSPFFKPQEKRQIDRAQFALLFALSTQVEGGVVEISIALRLPSRSKPLHVPNIKEFLEALRYEEPLFMGSKRYLFSLSAFEPLEREMLRMVLDHARFVDVPSSDRALRVAQISQGVFGMLLAQAYGAAMDAPSFCVSDEELLLPCVFEGNLETPLRFAKAAPLLRILLDYMPPPTSKILLNPALFIDETCVALDQVRFLECKSPGLLYKGCYFRFSSQITRQHLRHLRELCDLTLPEPLFGTLVENALPRIVRFAQVANQQVIEAFVTLPFVGELKASCDLSFLGSQLEATLFFHYEDRKIPAAASQLAYEDVASFVSKEGVLARHLVEERELIEELFQDFTYNPQTGVFTTKSEKKIVEFMTDIIPRNQHRIAFHCPQNLLDQFVYDQTRFYLHLSHTPRIDLYQIELKVDGALKGVTMDLLWECMVSRKAFIEAESQRGKGKREPTRLSKILVLDLERLRGVVQLFDELGIEVCEDHVLHRPLWSLVNIDASQFEGLPIECSISPQLLEIRAQMLGERTFTFAEIPGQIRASLRSYQKEGVHWLERLRTMYLNGILADDMGLGKTLQAICAIVQHQSKKQIPSLIVCPTSLLYNWKEECSKFHPGLRVVVVDGVPANRKRILDSLAQFDVLITSYTLLQKDIEHYKPLAFGYQILDEAQNIKNRGTRNAKSVKMVQAEHRLILTGTPIENSLEELWSLFDFLMPGFLSSYDRFLEKYVRGASVSQSKPLEYLRKKVAPFVLRRMKSDVLSDLPPVSEIVYHCQLSEVQQELYRSYAASARDELVKLVQRDGFDRVQIHVLATLTRLKQICCHPAIFAKERAEVGDSAKYDLLLDLVQTLIEGRHKTVIFSQYTRMLQIMRDDLEERRIRFAYLDGSSKNRLEVVKQFNEDPSIVVFLVSLKAGGTGLNLVGADTVIHYDMWWNPAVENQATDRIHRIGQKRSVSAYKLITLGTIEEKIAQMQERKKGLVKKVVSCDDEAIEKLTWEDVLELLKV